MGSGWVVNAWFTASATANNLLNAETTLSAYGDSAYSGDPINTLNLPATYRCFAYIITDASLTQSGGILAHNTNIDTNVLLVDNNSPAIPSVKINVPLAVKLGTPVPPTELTLSNEAKPNADPGSLPWNNDAVEFTYTLYFQDAGNAPLAAGTTVTYTGGILSLPDPVNSAPTGGTLTLKAPNDPGNPNGGINGAWASIILKSGQKVTLAVPAAWKVRTVQTENYRYDTSYTDSADGVPTVGRDTGSPFRTAGSDARTFAFVNILQYIPPTGMTTTDIAGVLPFIMLLLGTVMVYGHAASLRREYVRGFGRKAVRSGAA
jgi:hypothetical protein